MKRRSSITRFLTLVLTFRHDKWEHPVGGRMHPSTRHLDMHTPPPTTWTMTRPCPATDGAHEGKTGLIHHLPCPRFDHLAAIAFQPRHGAGGRVSRTHREARRADGTATGRHGSGLLPISIGRHFAGRGAVHESTLGIAAHSTTSVRRSACRRRGQLPWKVGWGPRSARRDARTRQPNRPAPSHQTIPILA